MRDNRVASRQHSTEPAEKGKWHRLLSGGVPGEKKIILLSRCMAGRALQV